MSVAGFFEIVGYVLSLVSVISILFYALHRYVTGPRLSFQVGGVMDPSKPLGVPPAGRVRFAISTRSRWPVHLTDIRLRYESRVVAIQARGASPMLAAEHEVPSCVRYEGTRVVGRGRWQGFRWDHQTGAESFRVFVELTAIVDEASLSFVFDWFPIRPRRISRPFDLVVSSAVGPDEWTIPPKHSLSVEGSLAQEAVFARTDSGTALLTVYEIIEDDDKSS